MILKRCSILTIIGLFILLILPSLAFGLNRNYKPLENPPETVQQAKEDNNNFLGFSYFADQLPNGEKLKMIKYPDEGHILVYGSQNGDKKGKEFRFLGVNRLGENISNMNFPNDALPEGKLDDQKWIFTPWKDNNLENHLKNKGEKISENMPFDADITFLPNIIHGIKQKLPDEYRGSPPLAWHKIVHILQPPTYYGWGVGRAWHKKADGSIWYRTIPIAPSMIASSEENKNNLELSIAGFRGTPRPGGLITVTAQAVNTSGQKIITDLVWKVNGQIVENDTKFAITSIESSSVSFPMPSGSAKVEAVINPKHNRPGDETNWTDNSDYLIINMQEEYQNKNAGDIVVDLIAPAAVEAAKPWNYQVKISCNWVQTYSSILVTPAKDGRPAVYRDEPDDPPTISLSLNVSGEGKHSDKYDPRIKINSTTPVAQKETLNVMLTGGTSKTYSFTFPATALINEGYYVNLTAVLSSGAADSARVYVSPYVVDSLKSILIPSD